MSATQAGSTESGYFDHLMPCSERNRARSVMATAGPPGSERDDGANDVAGLHGFEAVVDLVEGDRARHHLVELEAPAEVEVAQMGHVDLEVVRTHQRALDTLGV